MRLVLKISYDGTEFSGWAKQPGRRTVCGVLEDALHRQPAGDGPPVALVVAGRTDAGVHAEGQIAHVDVRPFQDGDGLPYLVDLNRMRHRWNRLLPPDVRVLGVTPAQAGFDARFSALRRHYAYRVSDAPWGVDPLSRNHVVAWRRPLDLGLLNTASLALLGEHDFVAFCKRRDGATTIRHLQRLEWARESRHVLVASVSADAFCHSMVRSLVGALLAVGEGAKPPDWPAGLLSATERPSTITVAPPHGLTLVGVDYPPDGELAARAEQTRNLRTLPTG